MVKLNRILSIVVVVAIVVVRFLTFGRVSDFWATLLLPVIPLGLALVCIWYAKDAEGWFGSETLFPGWFFRGIGWLVLLLWLGKDFVTWRMVAAYSR